MIEASVRDSYENAVMDAVQAAHSGITLSELVEQVGKTVSKPKQDVLSAIIWNLLASHRLIFNARRKLLVGSESPEPELAHQ